MILLLYFFVLFYYNYCSKSYIYFFKIFIRKVKKTIKNSDKQKFIRIKILNFKKEKWIYLEKYAEKISDYQK